MKRFFLFYLDLNVFSTTTASETITISIENKSKRKFTFYIFIFHLIKIFERLQMHGINDIIKIEDNIVTVIEKDLHYYHNTHIITFVLY